MQTTSPSVKTLPDGSVRYSLVSLGFLAVSVALGLIGRAPFREIPQVALTPDIALATVLLIVFGWSYLPVVFLALVFESLRTAGAGSDAAFVAIDSLLGAGVAIGTAYCVRTYSDKRPWGAQRDFLVFGICVFFLPCPLAAAESVLLPVQGGPSAFLLAWLATVVPLTALVPAGIKLAEWGQDSKREPLHEYLARGVQPTVQVLQIAVLVLGSAFIWVEQVTGGTGRVYPLFLVVFWMALTSGLSAAAVGFLVAQGLLATVDWLTRTPLTFELQLAATVMGSSALIAGSLVTARRDAEDKQVEQGEALRRQLAEMQVIRRLADSIIALREEGALYELGAEAIGEQLDADQVSLLWVPSDSNCAEERGFWASNAHFQRDKYTADLCAPPLAPLWRDIERSKSPLFSSTDAPSKILVDTKLDIPLHQASGVMTLLFHPFSFDQGGFCVAAILSYRRFRHWSGEDKQFVATVCDQITVALQKTQLLMERDERSRAFARMSQALVAETGETFFRNLVLRLSEAAGSRGAYASRVTPGETEATMLAFADTGRVRKEFKFETAGTPVEGTMLQGSVAIEDNASHLYPRFTEIAGVDVRGFAATRLVASTGEPLGTLAIYDDNPLKDPEHVASVLRLFATRASAEIERLGRERLLRESEASYRRVLETAHEGIWMVDAEGKTTYVNLGMASMLGYTPEEMMGKRLQDYVEVEERARVALDLQKQLVGTATQQDFRLLRHDGSFVWTLLSMSPIRDEGGEFRGVLAMITDITERKRTEQELDRLVHDRTAELLASNRELEAFCYSISHDLRQPLRAIDGFSRAVVEDLGEQIPTDVKDHLSRVRRAANRMSELIDALLTLSRLSRVGMKREKVDLSEIAEAMLADMARVDPWRSEGYVVRKGMTAAGDARLLHIALENLLSNAWKFSMRAEKPLVEFGTKRIGGRNCFYVRDNGIGFDMAYSSKLFKPFERLHSETDFNGTGIGLATVARIIDRHGGEIWAEATEGRGATFYFTL